MVLAAHRGGNFRCVESHDGLLALERQGKRRSAWSDCSGNNGEAMSEQGRSAGRPSELASGCCERLDRLVRRDYHYVQLPVHIEAASMDAITYTKARENLAQTIDSVCENHEPVIITKKNDRSVVMLSLEDYQALEETAYLLRNPKNARRLLDSVNELDAGGGTERALIE